MNENNQNLRNEQTPTEGVKQENVYTVGEYDAQNAAPAQQPMQAQGVQNEQPTPPPQAPQTVYTAPSGNNYTYSAHTPPYGQPGGYYTYNNAPQPPKKKKGKAFFFRS